MITSSRSSVVASRLLEQQQPRAATMTRSQGERQECPGSEERRQHTWTSRLHLGHNDGECEQGDEEESEGYHHHASAHAQAEHGEGEDEEHEAEIDNGEPTVLCSCVTQHPGN